VETEILLLFDSMVVTDSRVRLNLDGNVDVVSSATFDVVCLQVVWLIGLEVNLTTGSILAVGLEVISPSGPAVDLYDISNIISNNICTINSNINRGIAHSWCLTELKDTVIITGHPEGVVRACGWDEPSLVHVTVMVALIFRGRDSKSKGFISYVFGLTGVVYSSDGNF